MDNNYSFRLKIKTIWPLIYHERKVWQIKMHSSVREQDPIHQFHCLILFSICDNKGGGSKRTFEQKPVFYLNFKNFKRATTFPIDSECNGRATVAVE